MRNPLLDDLAARTAGLVGEGLFKSERVDRIAAIGAHPTGRRHVRPEPVRQQLPRPRRSSRHRRCRSRGTGSVRIRHGLGAIHLRNAIGAQGARGPPLGVPGHRGHHLVLVVLRRQRRAVRDHPRRAGRGDLRRAQPRIDHRRHPPVPRHSACATTTATWTNSSSACRNRPMPAIG